MTISSSCMVCIIQRQMENIKKYSDEDKKSRYMKELLSILANAPEGCTAPVIMVKISELFEHYWGHPFSFDDLKLHYNTLMLEKEDEIRQKIADTTDPLITAIKYARIGNYIDFGAMGSIDNEKLDNLLNSIATEEIPEDEYQSFINDLSNAKHLVYLSDNCGEIVLDKLLIEVLMKNYPTLKISMIVRGEPILNDVTLEDAKMVGLTNMINVIGNGTKVAGTAIDLISPESLEVIHNADLLISKGQANFESLHGCGLNIYYMFLCKCDWFTDRFQLEKYHGVFINEKNQKIL